MVKPNSARSQSLFATLGTSAVVLGTVPIMFGPEVAFWLKFWSKPNVLKIAVDSLWNGRILGNLIDHMPIDNGCFFCDIRMIFIPYSSRDFKGTRT